MAFVSDKYKLLFVHIPKNAGTTISDALAKLHGEKLVGIEKGIYQHDGVGLGVPPRYRPNRIDGHDTYKDIIRRYRKAEEYQAFAVISNPWARIFSYWKHKRRRGDKDLDQSLQFKDVMKTSNVLLLQPQTWWLFGYDNWDLLRKENLADDWAKFLWLNGIEHIELENLNANKDDDDYSDYYDDYCKDLIREFYRAEIEKFGYEF